MSRKSERLLLFIIFIFCFSLRLAFINQKNLWFDEVFSWHLTLKSFYEIIIRTSNDIHPPLYYFILKLWNFVFGDSVVSMRILSAIFSSAAIFFIYPLCKRVLTPVNSFTVLILYSVSPLNLYYSQEARMAAMNLFLNIGSIYFFIKLIDKQLNIDRLFRDKGFYLYVFFIVSALYTHYFSFLILTTQLVYLLYLFRFNLKKYKLYFIVFLSVIVVYLFWLPKFIEHISRGQRWRGSQSLFQVLREYFNYIKDMNLGLYYHYTDLDLVRYISILISLFLVTAFVGLFLKNKIGLQDKTVVLILLLSFVPLTIAGIISFNQKIEFYRYLSIIIPYILIFLVYGISKWNSKILTIGVIGCFALVNIYGINIHYSFKFKNDDYRELIKQINSEYKEGDRIYVEPHYYGWIIDYYKKQDGLKIPKTVHIRYGWNEILDSINTQRPERFWLVIDFSSVDTTNYRNYIMDLSDKHEKEFNMTYYLAPTKVELYRFLQ